MGTLRHEVVSPVTKIEIVFDSKRGNCYLCNWASKVVEETQERWSGKQNTMIRKEKRLYEVPATIVVLLGLEGIVCQSDELNDPADYSNGEDPFDF